MQVLVFFHQYKINQYIKGPGWWLTWSAMETLGFALILLREVPAFTQWSIIFQNPIIFLGAIFIYIGVLRFFNQKVNRMLIISIITSYAALHLIFIFVRNDILIRTLVFDAYIASIAFITAFTLFKYKTKAFVSSINFNIAIFIVHGAIFTYRTIMILSGTPFDGVFSQSLFNLVQYFDALIVALLWTFGFIIMLNQRLNAEILETKAHFEEIFNTSPDTSLITRLSDGLIVDLNENFSKTFGYTKNELLGKSTLDISMWKNPKDRLAMIQNIEENGYVENFEALFQRKNGEVLTGLISAKGISLNGNKHIISITRDITDRKEIELNILKTSEALTFLAQFTKTTSNSDFFEKLALYLADALEANFVCIDKLEGDGLNATTIAVWHDGNFEDNVTYALKDTPCGDVVGKAVCCFPASVTRLFPNDTVLQDLKAESYVGVTLWSHSGTPIGLIAVIKKAPLSNQKQAEELLKLVSIRASGELERIEAEETLKDSEQRLQFVLQGSELGFWDWDLKTNEVKRNEKWAEMLGYKLDEVEFTVKQWIDFIHPDDQAIALKSIQDHLDGLTPTHKLEYRMQVKTGEYKWILDQAQAVAWDSNRKVIRMSGTHTDITERKMAEIALQENEKKYRLLFQNLSVGFALHEIILNSDGNPCDYRFLEINPTFEILTGLKANDLIGKTILEILPNTESYWIDNYGKVALTGMPVSFENYSVELNRHYHVNAYSPEYGKFATIINDITEKKQVEIEIQNKNVELTKISSDKDRFISILAHDLKSPFNTILGYLELLTENVRIYDINKIENQIEIINQSAQNTYNLLEDILMWARTQSGKIPFEPKKIICSRICEEVLLEIKFLADIKKITISHSSVEDIAIFADIDMLKTILRNLISNAIKFTNPGGKINISIKQQANSLIISVSDNGIGIPPETINKLFDATQTTTTKGTTYEGGTGLGLILCKEFVEKHEGKIWVESEVGKGSTFYFTLQKE